MSNRITKVMKYELTYIDGCGDLDNMEKEVKDLQQDVREILNKTVHMAYDWYYRDNEHYRKTGTHLNINEETGYDRYDGYIYKILSPQYPNMAAKNVNASIQKAWKKYNSDKSDVDNGNKSLPTFKNGHPILLHPDNVKIKRADTGLIVTLTLFSLEYKKNNPIISKKNVRFTIKAKDTTQRIIIDRIITKQYKLGECQLTYQKEKWFLSLNYSFEPVTRDVDPDKILGIDMGAKFAICAASLGDKGFLIIEGNEVTAFAEKLEARRRSMQRQTAVRGDGRIGHGTKTAVAPVFREADIIANFRDTVNHRYSRAVVEYAVKNGYGTIQMEDLSGIREDTRFPTKLRHWTYFDLQTKIENKAKEYGIRVVKINPRFTSQRCSKCGFISSENRKTQSDFCCVSCSFKKNADLNAAMNISVKDIDKLISKEPGASRK